MSCPTKAKKAVETCPQKARLLPTLILFLKDFPCVLVLQMWCNRSASARRVVFGASPWRATRGLCPESARQSPARNRRSDL